MTTEQIPLVFAERALVYRVFAALAGGGVQHVASVSDPAVAAEVVNMYGAGSVIRYKGHTIIELDVNVSILAGDVRAEAEMVWASSTEEVENP